MSGDLDMLAAAGDRERIRLTEAWRDLDRTSQHLSAEAVAGIETAGKTLKWGSFFLLAAAFLARGGRFRTGWKIGKLAWAVAPTLARIASPRGAGWLSHLLRRGNSEKG